MNQSDAGSTDCTILESTLGEDRLVCGDGEVILDGTTEGAASYLWYVYNENTGNYDLLPGETGPTLTVTKSGNYRVEVTDEFNESTAKDDVNVYFYDVPVAKKPKKLLICPDEAGAVDLTQKDPEINNGNSQREEYIVEYYESQVDVDSSSPIQEPSAYSVSKSERLSMPG